MKRGFIAMMVAVVALVFFAANVALAADAEISERWLNGRWEAQWCAHPDGPGSDQAAFLYRYALELERVPEKFVIHVSADQRYQLYVNGERVASGPARGDLMHWRYETIDVAPWLKPGKNILAARAWSLGILAPWAQMTSYSAFIVQGDGEEEKIVNTPSGWRVFHDRSWEAFPKPGSRPSGSVTGANERITAALHPWGWMEADFDDSQWKTPIVIAAGVPVELRGDGSAPWFLTPRTIPFMREKRSRLSRIVRAKKAKPSRKFPEGGHPFEVPANTKAVILFDNGTLTNGYPELIASGGAGAVVRLSYEESLFRYPDVLVWHLIKGNRNKTKRCAIRPDYKFDEFLLDGGKSRSFSPLWWRTYRYLQLNIQTGDEPLIIEDLTTIETGYPFEARASFESSDPSLSEIWDTGWRTARLCAGETYFDCPYYEQLQYVGDTRIQAIISYYVSGDDRLARNAIEQLYNSRLPEGLTMSRYPSRMHQVIPPFSLAWIGMIHDHWIFRGDDEFAGKYLGGVRGVLGWFETRRLGNGLLGELPWWNFVDWAWSHGVPPGVDAGGSSIVSLQYALALREAAALEEKLGDSDAAQKYLATADEVVRAVVQTCWSEERDLLADSPARNDYSQHANILAALANLSPQTAGRDFMERVIDDKSLTQATFQFRFFLHKALVKSGLGDRYISMLEPWKKMLAIGLTTFPETGAESRSDCHAWSASPTFELLSIVCGITPGADGFSSARIEPRLSGLDWAKCEVPHPRGMIHVSLRREGEGVIAEIDLPPGLPGTFVSKGVETPLKPGARVIEFDD